MRARAHTIVTPGAARIGNRWFERSWSAFIGNTVELTQQAGPYEWAAGDGPEFRIECEDSVYGVMEMGTIEWSEECSPYAAGLVMRKESPEGLGVTVLTHAFHDHPGQLRRVRVFNTGSRVFTISRICVEALRLGRENVHLSLADATVSCTESVWVGDGDVLIMARGDRGLILGIAGMARYELFAPDRGLCAIVIPDNRILLPGAFHDLPPAWLIPFSGKPGEITQRLLEGFRERVDSMLAWESRRLKAIPEEESPQN